MPRRRTRWRSFSMRPRYPTCGSPMKFVWSIHNVTRQVFHFLNPMMVHIAPSTYRCPNCGQVAGDDA